MLLLPQKNNNQSSKKSAHWAIGLPSLASVSPVHTLSGSTFFIPCSVACARQRAWGSMAMISPQALKSPLTPPLGSPKLSLTGPFQPQLNWKNRAFQSTKLVNRNIPTAPARAVAGASASGFSPDISEKLGDVRIFTAAGEPVLFKDLWDQKEGIAVVALLRHFGCFCCWELAASLKEVKPQLDAAGVKLIAVGVGEPRKAQMLGERLPFPMDCLYADPERKAYDVMGLYFGFGRTFFNPASGKVFSRFEAIKKATEKYTIEATPDDRSSVLQQGGMFVFKGKELLYARKDEGTGDHTPLNDILDACCKVPAS